MTRIQIIVSIQLDCPPLTSYEREMMSDALVAHLYASDPGTIQCGPNTYITSIWTAEEAWNHGYNV